MAIFNRDDAWFPVAAITPLGWIVVGFLAGYFLSNAAVFAFTGILVVLCILALIDCRGRELDVLLNWAAIWGMLVGLAALWVTTLSVNHWWANLIPSGLLRK